MGAALCTVFVVRRQTRKRFDLQKAYFEQLFENSPEGIVILDDSYRVIDANESFTKLFQFEIQELRHRFLNDLVVPEKVQQDPSTIQQVTLGNKVFQKEALRKRKDGELVYVSVLSFPIEVKGRSMGIYEIYNDITLRKKAEKALKESHERFVTVMDSLDAGVYVADMETYELLFVNKYLMEHLGNDLTGKKCYEVLHKGRTAPCDFCTNRKLMEKGESTSKPLAREGRDEVTGAWCAVRDRAIRWVDGRIVRLQIATDITEIKQTENKLKQTMEALRRSEERLRMVVENMPVMMMALGGAGEIQVWNRECERVTGYRQEDMAGNSEAFKWLYPDPDDRARMMEMVHARSPGEIRDWEVSARCNDGAFKRISWSNISGRFPIRGWSSWAVGVDVTERKQLEEERIDKNKLEFIQVLTGGIAHDFNNLLTPILGNVQLARMQVDSPEKVLDKLERVEKVTMRAKEVIKRLQTFSRKKDMASKETFFIGRLVDETLATVLGGSNATYRCSVAENLLPVQCDPAEIAQAMASLAINAREAMPDGGVVEVEVANERLEGEQAACLRLAPGPYVRVGIRDHGKGVAEEHLSRIFDPYFTTKPRATDKLTGLGLAITRSIVESHGGRLVIARTRPGEGSLFRIYLPAVQKPPSAAPLPDRKVPEATELVAGKAPPASLRSASRPKILLMDDEESVREVCAEMIRYMGCEVSHARSGEEALEKFRESRRNGSPYDVVILDLTVPGGMGAVEAVNELRAADPAIKAVVSSGYSDDPSIARFEEFGFRGAVKKPFQFAELEETLKRVLSTGEAPR